MYEGGVEYQPTAAFPAVQRSGTNWDKTKGHLKSLNPCAPSAPTGRFLNQRIIKGPGSMSLINSNFQILI